MRPNEEQDCSVLEADRGQRQKEERDWTIIPAAETEKETIRVNERGSRDGAAAVADCKQGPLTAGALQQKMLKWKGRNSMRQKEREPEPKQMIRREQIQRQTQSALC